MSRAEKDVIARDRAGIERFVAFGSDIPLGWEYVRDADPTPLPPHQEQPRAIANAEAAAVAAERLQAAADRASTGGAAIRSTLPENALATGDDPGAGEPHGIQPLTGADLDVAAMNVEELQAEADRLGLQVTGTGAAGNVVRKDLEAALKAAQ